MTTAHHWLDDVYTPSAADEKSRTIDKFAVEAVGSFGLVLTVSVGLCSRSPFAALGIGAIAFPTFGSAGR